MQLAQPAESIFQSSVALYSKCVIFAGVLSELRPAYARALDRYQLKKGWVYKGGDEDLRCFNSASALGKDVCYNISAHKQCSTTLV
mmetsp:Transcript_33096/g.51570  ORF Transcript_33096/g.51570 Transcript_33096/m.51570 type:complete len:86 (-) Transcript_33096:3-260(-)